MDPPEKVLVWIEKRITCQIPDKDKEPELYDLVTRYQMHKCSAYCKKPKKCGTIFVKMCKFGFPRPVRDTSCLNCVEDSLKTKGKLYHLKRTEDEVKINDYNPLLLKVWKANMDIQYIAESTLALAHYVSGYVTKLREVTYRTSGRRSVTTSRSIAGCGASEFDTYALESVGSMKPVTCYLATTSVINLARLSG